MFPWFQTAQCGHQAWIGLSEPNALCQAHSYQSWGCNWGPGWYYKVVLSAETAGSSQVKSALGSREATRVIRAAGAQMRDSVADVTMSSAGWAFTWNMGGSVTLGLSWCQETQGYFLGTFSVVDSQRWAPSQFSAITGIVEIPVWCLCSDSFLKVVYQSLLTVLGAWQYTYPQKISLLKD